MGKHEKKAYLKQIKPRYKKGSKAEKQRILDEFCAVCGYHRKYAIRALNRRQSTQRSRPYKKNDNAHVEQKNWTHVRQLFGYDRFDQPILVKLMDDLYQNEWGLLQNYSL